MAIKLIANYSERLGLPGYSSHQFSVSVETELVTTDDIPGESERLYQLLQTNVDEQILVTGFVPPSTYGMEMPTTHGSQASGASTNNDDAYHGAANSGASWQRGPAWKCSDKQRDLILKLVEEHQLDKTEVEALAVERFGKGVRILNKIEASGLIDELLDTHVGDKSPADGVMKVDDVILGIDGQPFTDDARKSLAKAIQEAEKEPLEETGPDHKEAGNKTRSGHLALQKETGTWPEINGLAMLATGDPRFLATRAIKDLGVAAQPALNHILKAFIDTAEPLVPVNFADPIQFAHGQLIEVLFSGKLDIKQAGPKIVLKAAPAVARGKYGCHNAVEIMAALETYGSAARVIIPDLKQLIVDSKELLKTWQFPATTIPAVEHAIKAIEAAKDPKLSWMRTDASLALCNGEQTVCRPHTDGDPVTFAIHDNQAGNTAPIGTKALPQQKIRHWHLHEGHWGKDSSWLAENMHRLLTGNVPDVAVIHLVTEEILSSKLATGPVIHHTALE